MASLEKITVIHEKTGRKMNVNLCDLDKFKERGCVVQGTKADGKIKAEKAEKEPKEEPKKEPKRPPVEKATPSLRDLKKEARSLGIENYKDMSMDELIVAIRKAKAGD